MGPTHLREDASSSSPPWMWSVPPPPPSSVSPCRLLCPGMAPPPLIKLVPEIQHVIEVDDMEATPWPWRCSRCEVVAPL
jgi:hypothetical protein